MQVCSPLYRTAGILRGIFDFRPGHKEALDKWVFVFRKGGNVSSSLGFWVRAIIQDKEGAVILAIIDKCTFLPFLS